MLETAKPWIDWVSYCVNAGLVPACRMLWEPVALAVIAVGLLSFALVARRFWLDYKRKKLADRLEWERTQVDHSAIAESSWVGSGIEEEGGVELAEKIRLGIEENKRRTDEHRPTDTLG